ncbi:MAG: SAM-dependent chlorinase/fluorinase [Desulfobacteraceae bacterium]|nr:SAM-dependent chlorinase/fluorinase [Desulfobacteraceae bacterium]
MAEKEKRPIILLTDFGQKDTFTGILKGVIATISPDSNVIDLTHEVNGQDISQAAFLLATSYYYFPKGSVFCVIVDPGVGSERKALCIKSKDYYFVGPDNGVLWEAANENKIEKIIHLTNPSYFLGSISNTFHGRDIFAPVAAHISKGLKEYSNLGKPLRKCVEYHFPKIEKTTSSLGLTILHIDRFGNVTLNLKEEEFWAFVKNNPFCLTINKFQIIKVFDTYSQALNSELFLIGSSSSYIEISLKNSNAAQKLKVAPGQKAILKIF